MARLLSFTLTQEKNKLASEHVFTMLFELSIVGVPVPFRLASYDQDITFHGLSFLRFPLDVDSLEDATSASLVHLRVTAQNVDQQLSALLENYWRDDPDWRVTVWQIDARQPDETPQSSGEVFTVQQVVTDLVTAVLDLVAEGYTLTQTIPGRRYTTSGGFPAIPRR